jgi:DNA-binding NarL/FixJ family response regulator
MGGLGLHWVGVAEKRISVMLVDDHEVVREGLRLVLEGPGDMVIVAEAANVQDAVANARRTRPDVIVMDVRLTDGNGIEATREIRSQVPAARVLMLTAFHGNDALFASIMAGAAGYLLKGVTSRELVRAIRAVAAGQQLLDPSVTGRVLDQIRASPSVGRDERLARLTPREEQILALVAAGKTNGQIAKQVFLSERTVKNHVSTILGKLEVARRTEATAYLVRHSSRFE